jgi:hypothetical protein
MSSRKRMRPIAARDANNVGYDENTLIMRSMVSLP